MHACLIVKYVIPQPYNILFFCSLKKRGINDLVIFEASGRVGGKNLDMTLDGFTHNYMALGPSYFKTFLPLARVSLHVC